MTEQMVLDIALNTIVVAAKIASPALIATLVVGLLVSIFQAATQINEQNLVFIPKIMAMTAAIVVAGPWILRIMVNFTISLISQIPSVNR
ncbi:MAG: flagellar biosynthetic protein FliQ [Oligoflexus sp.]|jgi:flagellar biosynthetic protein FliQ